MVETSRGLMVALAATVLLILVVGVDASMVRTVEFEVEDGDGWATIGSAGDEVPPRLDRVVVEKNSTDEVAFRLTVDNGYAWAYEEAFVAYTMGSQVASGTLTAEARAQGEATFQVPVASLLSPEQPSREDPVVTLEATVGDDWIHGAFTLQEVEG